MSDRDLPSIEYLRQRLRYDPETGKLFWRACNSQPKGWNTRWAGREAFTHTARNGYLQGALANRLFYAHRVAWAIHTGDWPSQQVDHLNHDRGDNRASNMRVVTHSDNGKNQKKRASNTSGVMGVSRVSGTNRWAAYITVRGRKQHLGYFASREDAAAARSVAEATFAFHENHGRCEPPDYARNAE
jgi:hypothetical protein